MCAGARQAQVRQLADFTEEATGRRSPTGVCGDFNAGPDSDAIRMLIGRTITAVPGLVRYDAWELAGDGSTGTTCPTGTCGACCTIDPAGGQRPVLAKVVAISAAESADQVGQPATAAMRHIFNRLWVMASSFHSQSTALRPRRWTRLAPRTSLICPKTGSTVMARLA